MTVGEIWAVIWARTRHDNRQDVLAEMYAELMEHENE
jgi:hypothetical protein